MKQKWQDGEQQVKMLVDGSILWQFIIAHLFPSLKRRASQSLGSLQVQCAVRGGVDCSSNRSYRGTWWQRDTICRRSRYDVLGRTESCVTIPIDMDTTGSAGAEICHILFDL
jgi:hypothetical protein